MRHRAFLRRACVFATCLWSLGCAAGAGRGHNPAPVTAGGVAAIVERRCQGCHARPNPAAMSGERWRAALERMKRRIRLPAEEWDSLATLAAEGPDMPR